MNTRSKKNILIIEDDVDECKAFAKYINTIEDFELIGITASSAEGINYLKNYQIDIVILDIELHRGKGSGIEFIESLNNEYLNYRPMIVVISGNLGNSTYNFLHSNKVEYIFYKGEEDYSQEKVIKHIMSLAPYKNNEYPKMVKTVDKVINVEKEYEDKVSNKINKMLDDFGILQNLAARKYIFDAIYYLICEADKMDTTRRIAILSYLSNKTGKPDGAIHKSITNAIKRSWNRLPPTELEKMYTATLNYNTRNTNC